MSDPTTTSDQTTSVTHQTIATDFNQPVVGEGFNTYTIKSDIGLMMNYAINTGKELPNTLTLSENVDDATLIDNYNSVRKIIAPATVESIRFINSQMILKGDTRKWFQIPIFTKCVVIAGLALVALILISLSGDVNPVNQAEGLLKSRGLVLLQNLIFICAASLLGVMFYLLKTFGDKIRNYTLIPANSIELNASIIIGVISGFVISELFTYSLDNMSNQYIEIQKMTLALLGGFSSDAIFSTLQGIVNKFKKLVST